MPRRRANSRERPEPQGEITCPFDLAKKLRGAVQAKDLKTLERLFQRSEVAEMDDRRYESIALFLQYCTCSTVQMQPAAPTSCATAFEP